MNELEIAKTARYGVLGKVDQLSALDVGVHELNSQCLVR